MGHGEYVLVSTASFIWPCSVRLLDMGTFYLLSCCYLWCSTMLLRLLKTSSVSRDLIASPHKIPFTEVYASKMAQQRWQKRFYFRQWKALQVTVVACDEALRPSPVPIWVWIDMDAVRHDQAVFHILSALTRKLVVWFGNKFASQSRWNNHHTQGNRRPPMHIHWGWSYSDVGDILWAHGLNSFTLIILNSQKRPTLISYIFKHCMSRTVNVWIHEWYAWSIQSSQVIPHLS